MDWNNVADEYESLYETTTVQFLPHFLDVLKPRRGFTLTDVGCGPGVVSIAAAKAGATVTSVDISPNMVQRLQARAVEEGVASRLTALVGDGENLPLPVRHSHACVSNFGIIYCPDVDQALREMARVTTGGGWLVVTAWTTEDRNSWTALLPEGWEAEVGAAMAPRPQFRWQSSLELHVACEKANWNDVDVQVYAGSSMALPSADSSHTKGAVAFEISRIGTATTDAIASGASSAARLGTSSPKMMLK